MSAMLIDICIWVSFISILLFFSISIILIIRLIICKFNWIEFYKSNQKLLIFQIIIVLAFSMSLIIIYLYFESVQDLIEFGDIHIF